MPHLLKSWFRKYNLLAITVIYVVAAVILGVIVQIIVSDGIGWVVLWLVLLAGLVHVGVVFGYRIHKRFSYLRRVLKQSLPRVDIMEQLKEYCTHPHYRFVNGNDAVEIINDHHAPKPHIHVRLGSLERVRQPGSNRMIVTWHDYNIPRTPDRPITKEIYLEDIDFARHRTKLMDTSTRDSKRPLDELDARMDNIADNDDLVGVRSVIARLGEYTPR